MNKLGQAFIEILPDLRRWGRSLRRDLAASVEAASKDAGARSGMGMAGALKKTLGVGVVAAGAGITAVLSTALIKGFSRLKAIDDAKGKLVGLGYSAVQVSQVMADALASVKGTAFGLGDAASQAAVLVAAGVQPGKDLTRTLKLLADTATIAGAPLGEIGQIFGKVAASGKVTTEVIQQLQDRGVPALKFLATQTGMSMGEVAKAVTAGKIDFQTFQAAMEKGLGGAALASGNTFSGAMANVGAALGRVGAALLGGVFSQLPNLFAQGIASLDKFTPVAQRVGQTIGSSFAQAVAVVKTLIAGFKAGEGAGGALRVVFTVLVTTLTALARAGVAVVGFFRDHTTSAKVLLGVMGAVLLVTQAYAAVMAVQAAGGLLKYISAIKIVTVVTKVWTALQWALNLALNANPISLVIIALVALGAGLVLAYKKSETFRNIVNGVWAAIKSAINSTLTFLQPYFAAFMMSMRVVGQVAVWLWRNVVVPAFNGIKAIIGAVVTGVTIYIKAWMAVIRVVASVVTWLYSNIVRPIFTLIGIAVKVFYALFRVYVGLITIAVKVLGSIFTWLYRNAIAPAVRAVGAVVTWLYRNAIAPALRGIGTVVTWLYRNIIRPTFSSIAGHIQMVWRTIISPVLSALRDVVQNKVAPAFTRGVAAIRRAWDGIREAAKAPVRFVVNTVINSGIIDTFNKIAGVFNVGKIGHVNLPKGFASGGKFNKATAIVGEGNTSRPEYVIPTDPRHRNRALGLYEELGAQLLAGGGIVGDVGQKVGGWVGNITDAITNPKAMLDNMLNKLLGKVPGGGIFRDLVKALPKKVAGFLAGKIKSKFSSFEVPGASYGSGGGGGTRGGLIGFGHWLQSMGYTVSEHPQFGGVTPGAHVRGSKHYVGRAIDVNHGAGTSSAEQAWLRKIIGPAITAGFHTIFMSPGHYNHAHIDYDSGGVLPPGLSLANNKTGRGELVAPNDLLETVIYRAMSRALDDAGVGDITVHVDGEEFKKVIRVVSRGQVATAASALKVGRR